MTDLSRVTECHSAGDGVMSHHPPLGGDRPCVDDMTASEVRRLPYGLVALIYLRDERDDLAPETRDRLDHITESESDYIRRCQQEAQP